MIVERRGWVTNVRIGPTGNRMSPHIWTEGGSLQIGGTSRMSREAHVRSCERLWVKLPGPTRPRFVVDSTRALLSVREVTMLRTNVLLASFMVLPASFLASQAVTSQRLETVL